MPTVPEFPSIPVPTNDPNSLLEAILALKQSVEMLTGQDVAGDKFAPHVFVQTEQPQARHVGDLWLCTGRIYSFNVWDGSYWLKIGDIVTPAVQDPQMYLNLHRFIRRRGGG